MPEQIPENQVKQPDLQQTPVTVEEKKVNPLTIAILLIVILLTVAGAVYVAYTFGKKSAPPEIPPQSGFPTSIPTQISTPTSVVTSPANTLDETTNWKNYRNEKEGFEVLYPGGFSYSVDCTGTVKIEGLFLYESQTNKETNCEGEGYADISIYRDRSNISETRSWINTSQGLNEVKITKKDIMVGGIVARRYLEQRGEKTDLLKVDGTGHIYDWLERVHFTYKGVNYVAVLSKKNLKETFDQILSTFKFLD